MSRGRAHSAAATLVVLLLAGVGATAPTTSAQDVVSNGVYYAYPADHRVLDHRVLPVRATGSVTVAFASDPATCATVGRCGLDGVVVWRPGEQGSAFVADVVPTGRRRRVEVTVSLVEGRLGPDVGTSAQVRRATADGSRVCADHQPDLAALSASSAGGTVSLGLGDADDLLATRCAGPLSADVAAVLPRIRLTRAELRRGRRTLDLRGERRFAAGGLAGTVRSTLRVALGRPARDREGDVTAREGVTRSLEVAYRVTAVGGEVVRELAGDPDPLACAAFDTCGLTGTLALTPDAAGGSLSFTATTHAPGRTSAADLRAALAGRGRVPAGTQVFASGALDAAVTATAAVRPGGTGAGADCTDRRTGRWIPSVSGGRSAQGAFALALSPLGALRSRCPEPVAALDERPSAVTTTIARGAVGDRRLVLRFRRPATETQPGFRTTTRPDLTITLDRVAVRERGPRPPAR